MTKIKAGQALAQVLVTGTLIISMVLQLTRLIIR